MQFNSLEFLFYFLPLFLAVYLLSTGRGRTTVLVAGSLAYYAFASGGNYWWVGVLVLSTLAAYGAGRLLERFRSGVLLGSYLAILMGTLCFFKLYDAGAWLPSGMSFYFFQIAAYFVDIYRQNCPAEWNILDFSGQIVMFPKLLSGPLMNPDTLRMELKNAKIAMADFREGMEQLIFGLGMKVLLANRIGGLWTEAGVVGYENVSVPFAWIALIAYAMQLYFDFYGYSLMAMGLGRMLGFRLPRNFENPYISKTVSEFYRRWHVTLGEWFREYLYIPLGGNRKGTLRTLFNLGIVWLFTGLWHGVGGNYLLWAGFLFVLIVNERLWLGKRLKESRVVCHVYLVVVILISWLPFAVGDWSQMVMFAGRLLGLTGKAVNPADYLFKCRDYLPMLLAGVILATPFPRRIWEKLRRSVLADVLLLLLFWVVVYYIATAAQDPFLYFQY